MRGEITTPRPQSHPLIFDACQVVVFFARDHKRGEISCVNSQEDDGEHRPDITHEPGGIPARAIDVHGSAEQHRPYEPVGTEQREFVTCKNRQSENHRYSTRGWGGSLASLLEQLKGYVKDECLCYLSEA